MTSRSTHQRSFKNHLICTLRKMPGKNQLQQNRHKFFSRNLSKFPQLRILKKNLKRFPKELHLRLKNCIYIKVSNSVLLGKAKPRTLRRTRNRFKSHLELFLFYIKNDEEYFWFHLKFWVLFVLRVFKVLSWHFGQVAIKIYWN